MENQIDNDFLQKTFMISYKHLDFLENINKTSSSQALRQILDWAIEQRNNNVRFELYHNFSLYIVLTALGVIFFLFSMNYTVFFEIVLCYVFGLFMVIVGVIGGVSVAVQSIRGFNAKNR